MFLFNSISNFLLTGYLLSRVQDQVKVLGLCSKAART